MKNRECVQTIVTRRYDEAGAVIAWTDGSCHPNPGGPGGWGVRLERDGQVLQELCGGEPSTTNNRMEMLAIVRAIEAAPVNTLVIVRSDSQLAILCAVGRWKRKANMDLWAELDRVSCMRPIVYEWWRGHVGTPGNERADELAGIGRDRTMHPGLEEVYA